MKELFRRFWNSLTHLDGKLMRVIWQLLIPGKVTLEYFKGRQKRYPHPVQFFLVIMFFFLWTYSHWRPTLGNQSGFNITTKVSDTKKDGHIETDSILTEKTQKIDFVDFQNIIKRYGYSQDIRANFDSLPERLRKPEVKEAIDSLLRRSAGKSAEVLYKLVHAEMEKDTALSVAANAKFNNNAKWGEGDSLPVSLGYKSFKVAVKDLANLKPEELVERYNIKGVAERLLVRQTLKSIQNPETLLKTYLSSFSWTILALITFMSFVLGLFYFRQKRYYVEHFVFLLHQNSGAFLLLTLMMLLDIALDFNKLWFLLPFLWIDISLLIAMRRYYGSNSIITFLKWTGYNLIWVSAFAFFFAIGLFICLAVF